MLSKRQNLLETIRGGNPDRFVNQWEAFASMFGVIPDPNASPPPQRGGPPVINPWGVYRHWPDTVPGPFPIHDDEHTVLKDITKWKDIVKAPPVHFPAESWGRAIAMQEGVDRSEQFAMLVRVPGIFGQLHNLMGMEGALMNFILEPEAVRELVDYITEWEMQCAAEFIKYYKPDALCQHDDYGSQFSTFLSPAMFEDYFLEPYKKLYGFYKDNGVEVIIHHTDSYAATLVPMMIEMGADIWQGCLDTNNVPELVKKYGGKMSFMGDLNSGKIDIEGWTQELVRSEVERACRENGTLYYIPCLTEGGPNCSFPGVNVAVSAEIDRMSAEMFGA